MPRRRRASAARVKVSKAGNCARWLDTFANTTGRTITVEVAFGGTAGLNTTQQPEQGRGDSSSGDTTIGADDTWVEVANSPNAAGVSTRGPSRRRHRHAVSAPATSSATRSAPAAGDRPGGQLLRLPNTLTLAPGETESLLRYVVAGRAETTATAGAAGRPRSRPARRRSPATPGPRRAPGRRCCTVANWAPLLRRRHLRRLRRAARDPARAADEAPVTTSRYDVVDKTITQLQADMESGLTTSQEITRAYLDRIAAYDTGQFGFHAFITVAEDAMAQAKAADDARAAGESGDLLGIPVAVKDLYDTKDMPTTDGIARLRGLAARARTRSRSRACATPARSSSARRTCPSSPTPAPTASRGYGKVWNAFKPSKTSLGSSGGSGRRGRAQPRRLRDGLADRRLAVRAVDRRLAGHPARHRRHLLGRRRDAADVAAGLRGPDRPHHERHRPRSSTSRPAPTRRTSRPSTPTPTHKRPADWRTALDPNALQGKRIGYMPSAFDAAPGLRPGRRHDRRAARRASPTSTRPARRWSPITAAAPAAPATGTLTGNRTEEGWQQLLRPARQPAVPHGGGDPVLAEGAARTTAATHGPAPPA